MYVREQLNRKEFRNTLSCEIVKLQGYGYVFTIETHIKESDSWEYKTFEFDKYNKENVGQEFIEFYEKNCIEGSSNFMLYHYPRKDERISNQENIKKELLKHIEILYPLYNLLSWPL